MNSTHYCETEGMADTTEMEKIAVQNKAAEKIAHNREVDKDEAQRLQGALPIVKSIDEILEKKFPPRKKYFGDWLLSQSIAMIHAQRGIGKSLLSWSIGYAVACGSEFLKWKCEAPTGVLLVDGEMSGPSMQQRLKYLKASGSVPIHPFKVITPDMQFLENGDYVPMPDISTHYGRKLVELSIPDDANLIILDNLSTLCHARENDGDDWAEIQNWLVYMRAKGKTILIVHHSGKSGAQRGTSRREDIVEAVINLRHPQDYDPEEGAHFEWHFEKARDLAGESAQSLDVKFETIDGVPRWHWQPLALTQMEEVIELTRENLSVRAIAEELGLDKSKVNRLQQKAREEGLLLKN